MDSQKNAVCNWSGIKFLARQDQFRYPTTESEIVGLVKQASSKVHVLGTGLSYEQLASLCLDDNNAILLCLQTFTGLIRLTESSATFAAATTVNDVVAILGKLDRMVACSLGVIGIQTLAGAISTGTHGQGLFQSDYATTVLSLRVLLASGDIITVTDKTVDYPLAAFVTSLGTLGIILEVEMKTEPRRIFLCTKLALTYKEFLSSYVTWNDEYEYVKVWWFPETDQCHVWLVEEAPEPLADAFRASDRKQPLSVSENSDSMNSTVDMYLKSMSHDTKVSANSDRPQFKTVRRFADTVNLVGYQEQILCKGINSRQVIVNWSL